MVQNRREIIQLEIISLKKSIDKYNRDNRIIDEMIDGLISDKIGIEKDCADLTEMVIARERDIIRMNQVQE